METINLQSSVTQKVYNENETKHDILFLGTQTGIIKVTMADTRIGGADFLHCWFTDSI